MATDALPRDVASTCALLGADQIKDAETVFFAACEPDYHVLRGIGWPVVAFNGRHTSGVNTLLFANKRVVLLRTKGDRAWARRAHEVCHEYAGEVLQIRLDVPLYVVAGRHANPEALTDEERSNVLRFLSSITDDAEPVSIEEGGKKPSQATALTELAAGAELFHDRRHTAWATVRVDGHPETYEVRSTDFRLWLRRRYHEAAEAAPNAAAMTDAIAAIEAEAVFSGCERETHLRTAEVEEGYFVDLGDPAWRAIKVTADGWEVVDDPPVRFYRAPGMRPLPVPVGGGSIEDLRPFVNCDDDAFVLLVAFILGALMPRGPFPILALSGEQGSGKSTACRIVRSLTDPNEAPVRRAPRDERDLFISCRNARVVAFDNLSGLPAWLSDALCTVSTGGGFAVRKLYSDSEETIVYVERPIIVNGINQPGVRSDFRDRCVDVFLARSFEDAGSTRSERDLWADFEAVRPRVFGALADAVSMAMRRRDEVVLDRPPRMTDFARWIVAAEPALPWAEGRFLSAYTAARASQATEAVDNSVLASSVMHLLDGSNKWSGTASDLLARLNESASAEVRGSKAWPASARILSGELRRLAPDLRRVAGIEVDSVREGRSRRRVILLEKVGNSSSASSASSAAEVKSIQRNELGADDGGRSADANADDADDESAVRTQRGRWNGNSSSAGNPLYANSLASDTHPADDADDENRMFSGSYDMSSDSDDDDLLVSDPAYTDRLLRNGGGR